MRDFNPKEFKIVALRECPTPMDLQLFDAPAKAFEYWQAHLASHCYFDPERECLVALLLNTRHRIKGHCLISIGTLDTLLIDPRAVFRPAVIASAAAIALMHNHPSGDPTPSPADIKVTRDLVRAGQILRIEVLDHIVVGKGEKPFCSLRELGYLS
jgi:DNA repair protein RadC